MQSVLRNILLCFLVAAAPRAAPAAIDLDDGDYLSWSSAPVTAAPLTIYCRFLVDSHTNAKTLVSIAQSGNHDDGSFTIGTDGSGGAHFRAYASEAGGYSIPVVQTPTLSTGTWYHGFGIFNAGDASRFAYLNDSASVEDTTSRTPAGLNGVRIGQTSPTQQLVGRIAEVCIWNVALSSTEHTGATAGCSELAVASAPSSEISQAHGCHC